ncbi:lipoprotein insertase outer membrane protein LolB [Acinetobacter nectaris]|uniref:lipoprotein insertase outer membrane protein LolB n=1 Tax=Acinetobacter nectaris TaxID=1219382 RepID=UPI001F0170E8|nr:lipoprotein insertase outer membrane protein LolB [Acinetobacter nectaris]MCF9034836.1 outer membrane lipoprotein LolB [Acinetobacter nectaris]
MRLITKLSLACIMGNTLILSGCQNYVQPQQALHKLASEPAKKNTFQLDGKIGVRTAEQSGSAFFTWAQQDNYFNIDLTGALGIGKTHIEGQPGQVTLTSAKTGTISASSPEELLEKATGWQTPITDIIQWVQAKTSTNTAQTTTDSKNRLTNIVEDGWNVSLIYNDETQTLPNKLVLKQVLPNEQENRITMVIQNRTMN